MSDRAKAFERFVRSLDTRKIVGWSDDLRIGKPLYDHILELIRSGDLRPNQTANALIVLHRLRRATSDREVFSVFVQALAHESRRVVTVRARTS